MIEMTYMNTYYDSYLQYSNDIQMINWIIYI